MDGRTCKDIGVLLIVIVRQDQRTCEEYASTFNDADAQSSAISSRREPAINHRTILRHCEERSDEAIQAGTRGPWIASSVALWAMADKSLRSQ
ncbi:MULTISPECIES: hypothetical protein [unclassified Bradyrhizobium]|uniref:hypothetical protein n=1 Tax=unclassified Bradyrhizobium TaxID=2631580 RepID=UPI0028EB1517|nr:MULTISPECIES: hypothetical protein [unclassified Bradyrhizobium]